MGQENSITGFEQLDQVLAQWQMPRLDKEHALISGTASGIAKELGIDPIYVRLAFAVLALSNGWGLAMYLGAWWFLRREAETEIDHEPRIFDPQQRAGRLAGFAISVIGALVLTSSTGGAVGKGFIWPAALVGLALALVLDRGGFQQIGNETTTNTNKAMQRLFVAAGLLISAIVIALVNNFSLTTAIYGTVMAAFAMGALALALSPMLKRMGDELFKERTMRIRTQERAEVAAHLHDSVLQTLSLIQKRSAETEVVSLARRQERELRTWLYGANGPANKTGLRAQLLKSTAHIEDTYGVPVEVVVVGDHPPGPIVEALVKANNQAVTNAALHSGAKRIDVFAEVSSDQIEIFVRDQGSGFDMENLPEDRAGIRDSIIGRMQRAGGNASIFTSVGSGTEVELQIPIAASQLELIDKTKQPQVAR